jgi:LmbE family N-acetylglucosaminyl deacetylase
MVEVDPIQRAMVIVAHPDDADAFCGGTVARMASEGKQIRYVICTDGARGGDGSLTEDELGPIRRAEQEAAAKTLGVVDVTWLDRTDGELTHTLDLRRELTREIRRHRPQLVFTHNPIPHYARGLHPDHLAVGQAVFAAIFPSADSPMIFLGLLREEGLQRWQVKWTFTFDAERPNHFEDIGPQLSIKQQALACHASQFSPELLERGPLIAQWEARGAADAGYPHVKYAEAFHKRVWGGPFVTAAEGHKVPG